MRRLARSGRSQAGTTLLEMLVVVAVMSAVILTIAVGLQTSQTATTDASIRSEMHLALGAFRSTLSAYVSHNGWIPPQPCPASPTDLSARLTTRYLDALAADPKIGPGWSTKYTDRGMSFKIVKVNYWQGGVAFGGAGAGGFTGTCGASETYLQEVVLSVKQSTMSKAETGSVVLRKRQTT